MTNNNISKSVQYQPVRSFVIRNGRMTLPQKQAIRSFWGFYGIDFTKATIDLEKIFGRSAPKILEIGSGMGDPITQIAKKNKDNDYLAVEVHGPSVGSLIRKINEYKLTNIRLISNDIIDILKYQLTTNSIDCIYIFFPDPWPKKRHHKRRLINNSFLSLVRTVLKPHGRLFIATDWENYAEHIIEVINNDPNIINLAGDKHYAPRPKWRPVTKFEQRGLNQGHCIYDLALATRY